MDKERYIESVREYKLIAKHEVGQNFLCSYEAASKIVGLANIEQGDKILEIGPGAGSLSVFLTDYPNEADLVDIDEGLITKLTEDFKAHENIHPLLANALKHDFTPYSVIIGNLPYYITSSLIERILLEGKSCRKAVIMVQKEAYSRLSSPIRTDGYGPLPILLSYIGVSKKAFSVSRDCFVPAPHVDSVVFTIDFRSDIDFDYAKSFYAFLNAAFLHRRKTIYNNLQYYLGDGGKAGGIIADAGINKSARPEALSLKEYLALFEASQKR